MDATDENGQVDYVNSDEGEELFVDAETDETMAVTVECPEQGCTGGTNGEIWRYTGDAAIFRVNQRSRSALWRDVRQPRNRFTKSGPVHQSHDD